MIWRLLLYAAAGIAGLSAGMAQAQSVVCYRDHDCDDGLYCEAYDCVRCLSCEDLKRESPRLSSSCIKSVADCGDCIKGLVEDHRGDINSVCVPPAPGTDEDGVGAYVWVAVVLGLVLLGVLVLVIVYLLRNTYTFKILASTRTSVRSPHSQNNASANEPPPPYDVTSSAPYNPQYMYTASTPPRDAETPARDDDFSLPFIKRVSPERGEGAGGREAAGHQAARVFNYPQYVRAPHLPSRVYKNPSTDESESTFTVHDEDTMESPWTPSTSADHTDTNGNAGAWGPLAPLPPNTTQALHAPTASHAPPETHTPHALCSRQDTNNNCNTSESGVSGGAAGGSAAPSFIINVVQNINAVKQHNDVTL